MRCERAGRVLCRAALLIAVWATRTISAGDIVGTVTRNGAPLEGALIRAFGPSPGYLTSLTDQDGNYVVPDAPAGTYWVEAFAPGWAFIDMKVREVSEQGTVSIDFDFVPGVIQGRVTENGRPLPDAQIRFPGGVGTVFVYTDADGRYSQEVQSGSIQYVRARTPDDAFIGMKVIEVDPGESVTADFDFVPAVVRGTITENGAPLEGAEVRFPAGIETIFVYTNESGDYYQRIQANTRQRVRALTPTRDGIIGGQYVELNAGEELVLDFDFTPCTLTGQVTENGTPVAGADICVNYGPEIAWVYLESDNDGRYRFRIQAGEPYYVSATLPNGESHLPQKVVCQTAGCVVVVNFPPSVEAFVDVDPDTLNLKSKGQWLTCYIALPCGYDAADIDVDSIMLENELAVAQSHLQDDVLIVKFGRKDVIELVSPVATRSPEHASEVRLSVTGRVNGVPFNGSDTVRVIERGR